MAVNLANLVAKISVLGTPQAISAMRAVQQAFRGMSGNVQAASTNIVFALTRVLRSSAATAAALSALAAIAVGGAFLGAASKAAADWEALRVTLKSVAGSAEEANKKLQFIRDLAVPAIDTEQALAAAGLQAEAFGLSMERALPIAARLSAAFPLDPEALEKSIRLMGRLAAGDFPDIELRSGLGLTIADFKEKGILFDEKNKMLSSGAEALEALDQIVREKYPGILDEIANITKSKMQTVANEWQQALRTIGEAFNEHFAPILDDIFGIIKVLSEEGVFADVGKSAAEIMINLFSVVRVAGSMLMLLMGIFQIFVAGLAAAIDTIILGFIKAIRTITFGLFPAEGLEKDFERFVKLNKEDIQAGFQMIKAAWRILTGDFPKPPSGEEFLKKIEASAKGLPFIKRQSELPVLEGIERNTRETAINTKKMIDFNQVIFGGGPLGQIGITPVEFSEFRRGRFSQININLRGSHLFEQLVSETIQDIFLQMKRQGAFI
jgi:hypothetical protein